MGDGGHALRMGLFSFGMSPVFQAGKFATADCYTPKAVDFASGLNICSTLASRLAHSWVAHMLMASMP
jgi:MFS transporter, DHA1 family, inner membrane transport protein